MFDISAPCEKGWERFNESCYFFSSTKMNYLTAKADCEHRGGHLADDRPADNVHEFLQSENILN